ncbi:progestin and adipoQ receptor family member 3-like [Ixodes scapularis]|uniref:progestin and adipoQ receptor family member 3-like n=1 Tax=Ixodes scapularis TaxID=6945 RepID=UPI001161AC56|nr:progestin and adipoQ receptor family member 3-like [Ixodes scapularis]
MAIAQDFSHVSGYDEAPAFLRQNPFIRGGYRVFYTPKQCLRSLFEWNNETLNIWTHLAGMVLFSGVLVHDVSTRLPIAQASATDSLILVSTCCAYITTLSLSVLYHTFNCQSRRAYERLLQYDIAGVSLSLWATFASGVFLAFDNYPSLRVIYILLEGVLLVLAIAKKGQYPTKLLVGLAAFGVVPTIHWVYLAPSNMPVICPRVLLLFMSAAASFLVLECRFPERAWPGRHDIVGASHQIWHVLVVLMTLWWHETAFEFIRCKTGLC